MPSTKAHVTSVRLDEWQSQALKSHAAKQDRSVGYVINAAINLLLRQHGYSPLDDAPIVAAGERELALLEEQALAARTPAPAKVVDPVVTPAPRSTRAEAAAKDFTEAMSRAKDKPQPETPAEKAKRERREKLNARRRQVRTGG